MQFFEVYVKSLHLTAARILIVTIHKGIADFGLLLATGVGIALPTTVMFNLFQQLEMYKQIRLVYKHMRENISLELTSGPRKKPIMNG